VSMSKEKSKDKHSRPCNGNNSVSLAGELQSKSPVSECGLGRAENRNHNHSLFSNSRRRKGGTGLILNIDTMMVQIDA
jgi:hypothetical protein